MRDPASVTFEKALDELREIAEKRRAENGGVDFIYQPERADKHDFTCKFVHGRATGELKAGCIVGVWAHEYQGMSLEHLANNEGGAHTLLDPWSFSPRVQELMFHTQWAQDRGSPWTEAVRMGAESAIKAVDE